MTDTKTTTKEINKTASKPTETSALAARRNESAATDNIYLAFLQKAFPAFGIPADALKKVEESKNDELAKSLLIAGLSGMTWSMLNFSSDALADAEKMNDFVKGVLRDRFRENDSLADEIKDAMKANAQVSAGWQAAFDEMKKLYDGSISEMREQLKNVRAEMDELRKKAAASIEPAVQSSGNAEAQRHPVPAFLRGQIPAAASMSAPAVPQDQAPTATPAVKPRRLFGRKAAPDPEPAFDAVEYQQNYLIFMKKFLENDDYSADQKKFLLECWNNGDSVAKIETFARPKFDVAFMRDVRAALEKRNGKK